VSNHFYEEGPPATGKKVLLAVPTYACPDTSLTFALARSREALTEAGIQSALLILEGNCHVDDGRNSIVRDFLESDCTDLVFLDADVTWEPGGLVTLCERDEDIVGGVYPYRREGSDNMPVRLMGDGEVRDGLREVEGLPTGFMKIRRHVLERMVAESPWYWDKIYPTALVFNRSEPDENHTRWGGDINFCKRWREMGGKLYAVEDIRLGHVAKVIVRDSLAAHLRRLVGDTLAYLAPRFRDGTETDDDYNEVFRYAGNNYAADAGVLALCVGLARKCRGPIIETGSGLSSVLMALAGSENVYSLEHAEHYAQQTLRWAGEAGVTNVGLCCAPMVDFWYDLAAFDLPNKFALGFCDGPPRLYGTRMRFFDEIAPRCSAILVDDIKTDNGFARQVSEWAAANGRTFQILGRCALLTTPALCQVKEPEAEREQA
jgi:predicted O-methyltransferase YrrM